jgi:hypothetical protein
MYSYLKQRFGPIVERVKSSPTTEYVRDRMSLAHQKVRGFIDKRVQGRSGDFKFGEKANDSEGLSKSS